MTPTSNLVQLKYTTINLPFWCRLNQDVKNKAIKRVSIVVVKAYPGAQNRATMNQIDTKYFTR